MDPGAPLAEPGASDELLTQYLAQRDAACWGCGYNLRGVQGPSCPECGRTLELALSRPGTGRGTLLLLVMAVGWVLLAAGMNGLRAGLLVRHEATNSGMNWVITTAAGGPVRGNVVGPGMKATVVLPPPQVTIRQQVSGRQGQVWSMTANRITLGTPPPGKPAWGQVRWQSWVGLGWWVFLGLLALSLLVALASRARTLRLKGVGRRMVGLGAAVFVLYSAGQVFLFAREMVG